MKRQHPIRITDECQEIATGVFYMEVGKGFQWSNVYFVRSGSSWVLIDAASPNDGQIIRKTAESLFGSTAGPASILLTHDHPDHRGDVLELAHLWDCPVYVHPDELPLTSIEAISTAEKYANPLDRWIIIPLLRLMPRQRVEAMFLKEKIKDVVQTLNPLSEIPTLPDWKCIPPPGHTPGHISLLRKSDRVLITGDALLTVDINSLQGTCCWCFHIDKPVISSPPWYSTWNWKSAIKSIMVLAESEPIIIASGHGAPMSGKNIPRALHHFADHLYQSEGM